MQTYVSGVEAKSEAPGGDDLVQLGGLPDARDVDEVLVAEHRVVVEVERGALPAPHLAPQQRRGAVAPAAVEDPHCRGARVVGLLLLSSLWWGDVLGVYGEWVGAWIGGWGMREERRGRVCFITF